MFKRERKIWPRSWDCLGDW